MLQAVHSLLIGSVSLDGEITDYLTTLCQLQRLLNFGSYESIVALSTFEGAGK
jgi:hypothetical protein